ncbi:MAG: pentapeptide repeat-containing protein [Planctomycetota bacterium]
MVRLLRKIDIKLHRLDRLLERTAIVHLLEKIGRFSIIVAVFIWLIEIPAREKKEIREAWQNINLAFAQTSGSGVPDSLEFLVSKSVDISGVNLISKIIRDLELKNARMLQTDFQSDRIENSRFTKCDLRGSHFWGNDFHDVVFEKCDLRGCNFTNADLGNTIFIDCLFDQIVVGEFIFEVDNMLREKNKAYELLATLKNASDKKLHGKIDLYHADQISHFGHIPEELQPSDLNQIFVYSE